MLFKQLCGLALSFLVGVSPISFEVSSDPLSFPLTRTDSIQYKISFDASDLGKVNENSENHIYLVMEHVDISCSSACSLANASFAFAQPLESQIEFDLSYKTDAMTPNEFKNTLTSLNSTQAFSEAHTYNSEASSFIWRLSLPTYGGGSWTLSVFFPAVNDGLIQRSTNYLVSDFKSDYEIVNYKAIIYRLVLDKDVPSDVKQNVLNYVNNGDYSSAVTYINNYYNSSEVSNTEYNETIINTYKGKERDLNTVVTNENNFSIGIENNFKNQILDLNPDNSVITNTNFQQAAVWVTDKFNRFTNNNAFGSLLGFSLLIGFALALIGRVLR